MPSRLRSVVPFAAVATALVLTAPVRAQLIVNPGFDSTVDGWSVSSETELDWSALDAFGGAGSGSARVTNLHESALDASGAYQCVDVQAETAYWLRSAMVVPAEEPDSTGASLLVQFYSTADCGVFLDFAASRELSGSGSDAWRCRGIGFTTPATTTTIRVRLSVYKQDAGGETSAHFDDVLLLEGLFFDDFECDDDLQLWSANVD